MQQQQQQQQQQQPSPSPPQQQQQQQQQIPIAAARHHVFTTSGGGGITPVVHAQELKSVKTSEPPNDYIACPTCTYHNQLDSVSCECCDTALIDSMNSSTNSLDNHVDNSDINEMNETETWSCPTCTYNNSIDVNTCEMCNHGRRPADMRRPDDIINDRLIHDDEDDDELCRTSASESSGLHPLTASALGALGGIMLARLQNRPMSTGALQGAAYGALGGMLLNELNSRVDDDMRSSMNSDNLYNNRHYHFFESLRQNNRSLFEAFFQGLDEDDDTAPSDERVQTINSLPTHTFHDDNNGTATCNICLEAFVNGDNVKTLPCLHMFHTSCIDTWLTRKSECPLCKYSLC
jgi:hypothetical protein